MRERRHDIAAAIMTLAMRRPPEGRGEWAKAMRAEFDSLEDGRLSWALGCLTTSMGWRAPNALAYVATLASGVFMIKVGFTWLAWQAMAAGMLPADLLARSMFARVILAYVAAACLVGALWPGRERTTALVLGLAPTVISIGQLGGFGRLDGLEIAGAPALAGWVALVTLCYLAASAGEGARRRLAL